jgi:hypothetical protein
MKLISAIKIPAKKPAFYYFGIVSFGSSLVAIGLDPNQVGAGI